MRTNYRQAGFTLVEIAIVLVIIGLLLGGILKGQEMITQARIKNVINDFNGLTAAYASYQDRYRAIPGDDARAGTRWSPTTGPSAGGGPSTWTGRSRRSATSCGSGGSIARSPRGRGTCTRSGRTPSRGTTPPRSTCRASRSW